MGSPVNWEDFFRVPGSAPLLRKTEVAAATLAVLWEESRQTRQSHHGKKDECLICQVPCNTVLLSKNTNSNIQTFFLGIDGLCKKYSQETSQISQLEESLRKSVLQIKRLQRQCLLPGNTATQLDTQPCKHDIGYQSSTIADALQGTIASSRVTAIQQSSRRAFSQC
ncbi:hypothetical protein NN561_018135 [Cricetulus griseus]